METLGGRGVQLLLIHDLVTRCGEWSASHLGRALPPLPHCTEGWVSTRAGLDTEATGKILSPLPRIEARSLVVLQISHWILGWDVSCGCVRNARFSAVTDSFCVNFTTHQLLCCGGSGSMQQYQPGHFKQNFWEVFYRLMWVWGSKYAAFAYYTTFWV
jgi:hypothetical protein